MSAAFAAAHDAGMTKRILAALLWFYAGWYFGAILAEFTGVSPFIGPVIGAAAAALFAGDPRGLIWKSRQVATAKLPVSTKPVESRTADAVQA